MRASIFALAVAAALTTTAAIAQQSPQTAPGQQTGPQMRGPMMGQGMGPGMMGQGMGPGMMGPGMMGQGMGPGMMGMMDPTQHIEGRLAFLKTELKVTDAQMPQWNTFADAARANAKRVADLRSTMMTGGVMGPGMMMSGEAGPGMTVPERLDRAEKFLDAHLEMLRAMKGPMDQLYASLSEEQKRTADQLMRGPMGMMGMM
jgi:hypothetical protein